MTQGFPRAIFFRPDLGSQPFSGWPFRGVVQVVVIIGDERG